MHGGRGQEPRDGRWRPLAFGVMLVLVAVVGLAAVSGSAAAAAPSCAGDGTDFNGGDGSSTTPYEITTVEQLQCMNHTAHLGANFTLTGDVDASDTQNWNGGAGFAPIGNGTDEFTGSFDGQGHTVSDLTIDRSTENRVGLFGKVQSGSIGNVTLANVSVTGDVRVGGLVGENIFGTVTNSSASGTVSGSGSSVGGLVGLDHSGTVTDSLATGTVSASGTRVGGLVGVTTDGSVTDSYATGNVTGTDDVGGLVGKIDFSTSGGTVTNSYATGTVNGTGTDVGGLVGFVVGGTVTDSYWDVDTTNQTTSDGGTGLTTTQMTGDRAAANLVGFDFTATWTTVADSPGEAGYGVSYPVLQSNTQSPAPSSTLYAGGDGSASNPYVIGDWYHLDSVRVNRDANYTLAANLDSNTAGYDLVASATTNAGDGFDPIGNDSSQFQFTGSFDGQDHTISNLTINRSSEDYIGLFGYVEADGSVVNVTIDDGTVTGHDYVGGLIGWNDGTVTGSSTSGTVTGDSFVGGLVGRNDGGSITNSYAIGTVDGADEFAGGLVGRSTGEIDRSYATGTVDGYSEVGGLVGQSTADISLSYAIGSVSGSANVGGLVGLIAHSTVKDAYWDQGTTGRSNAIGTVGTNGNVANVLGFDSGDGSPAPEMTGANATENMDAFAFPGTWHATDSYPALAWEDTDPFYGVTVVETTSPDDPRDTFNVTANVTNLGADGGSQTITLTDTDFSDTVQDSESTDLDSGESTELTLTWDDSVDDDGDGVVTVASENDTEAVTAWPYAAGNGSADNPYEIETWYHLDNVRENRSANYTLAADLDSNTAGYDDVASATANGGDGFDPVGDDSTQFTGSFEGQNHTISDLTVDRSTESRVGLFGEVGTVGSVANVTLVDGSVTGSTYVGGLVGRNFGTVTDSATTGDVDGDTRVGGLVGINDGDVAEAYATGNVTGSGDAVGGLVGLNNAPDGSVTDSYATGTVTGDADQVGGLVGENEGDVTDSYAVGNVSGNADVGGLVGFDDGGTVTDSYWDVDTTGQTTSAASPNSDGLTTAEMTGAAAPDNTTGFDFGSNWTTTDSYPHLRWAVENLTLDLGSTTLEPGDTTQATATLGLADGSTVTASTVANYTSNESSVATVDNGTGTVSALAVGTTNVTATFIGRDKRLLTVQAASSGGNDDDDDDDDGGSTGGSAGGAGQVQQFSFALVDGAGSTDLDATIVSIEVDFADDDASGTVTVEPSDVRPTGADPLPDASGLAFVDVTVPPSLTDAEATMQVTLDADALDDVDPADLAVYRYDDGEWTALDTTVVSTANGEVVIEATTPGFSLFAVGPAQQTTPDDATPDDDTPDGGTDASGPDASPTTGDDGVDPGESGPDGESAPFSGVTVLVALVTAVVLVGLALVAVRRRP